MASLTSIAPCFAVADVGATMRWYQQKLGFWNDPFPETEPHVFAILFLDHVEIMLQRIEEYEKPESYARRSGGVWDAYLRTGDVHETDPGSVSQGRLAGSIFCGRSVPCQIDPSS